MARRTAADPGRSQRLSRHGSCRICHVVNYSNDASAFFIEMTLRHPPQIILEDVLFWRRRLVRVVISMKYIALCVMALLLAGCATLPPPNVTAADLSRYRLASTEVEGVQVIRSWPAQEKAFMASSDARPDIGEQLQIAPAYDFPIVQAHFKRALETKIAAALQANVGPALSGQEPVIAVVKLRRFEIPSAAQRLLVGGSAVADMQIDLVEAKTRHVLVTYPGSLKLVPLLGGVVGVVAASIDERDVADDLIFASIKDYRQWLLVPR